MALNQVPQPGQNLLQTRDDIRNNWVTIDNGFKVNHVELGTAGAGKHNFLQMPEQTVAPVTLANEAGLYAAVGVYVTNSQLVFRQENNGPSIAFTEGLNAAANGWSRLPSGLLIKWGTANWVHTSNTTATLNYNTNTVGPDFGTCYQVMVATLGGTPTTTNSVNIYIQVVAFNATTFTAKGSTRDSINDNRDFPFSWFALGVE